MDLPAIEFVEVRTSVERRRALRGVSFAVPRHSITVLIGASGAGKTLCLRHVIGLQAQDFGEVLVDGLPVARLRSRELAGLRRRFGVMFAPGAPGAFALFGSMSVYDNIALPLRLRGDLTEAHVRERVLQQLEELGLAEHAPRRPDELSRQLRKRAALARALAPFPEFVLLDDFGAGIDETTPGRLCDLIHERRAREGGSYLIATRDIDVARRMADELVVLREGRIVDPEAVEEALASGDC